MSGGAYALAAAELAIAVGGLGLAAFQVRRRLLPGWNGAPGHLVESLLGIALALWIAEALGAVDLLREAIFVAACAAAGALSLGLLPRSEGREPIAPPAPPVPATGVLVTVGV